MVALWAATAISLCAHVLPASGATRGATGSTSSGVLVGAWPDPHARSTARPQAQFALALPDGRRVPLDVSRHEATAARLLGREVIVTGRALLGPVLAPLEVDALDAADAESDRGIASREATTRAATTTRKVLYLLVMYKDDTQVPRAPSFYTDLNNPDTPPEGSPLPATVNGFFKKVSYGQLSWAGNVGGKGGVPATDWLTLPKGKSGYADCGWSGACAQIGPLFDDAVALAVAQGIDVKAYDNINLVLANDLDCCAWGGGQVYDGKYFGVTWEPPWGQDVTTYVHEMGHSLGLTHSGWKYFAYDSPWDMMSSSPSARVVSCGTYASRNNNSATTGLSCTEPGAGYIAPYVDKLGWLPPANVVQVSPGESRVVQLQALSEPLASGAKMIRICLPGEACTGTSAHYLTVEARVRSGTAFDNGLTGEGIVIHDFRANRPSVGAGDPCYYNTSTTWAMPIDATPGDYAGEPACNAGGRSYPNYALYNAQWVTGQAYVDAARNVRIAIGPRSGASWSISLGDADVAPAVPAAPTNVRARPDDHQVQVSWAAVSGATQYNVLMGTTLDQLSAVRKGVPGTQVTIGNLVNGQRYYFRVVALNANGRSARSKAASAVPARYVTVNAIDLTLSAWLGNQKDFQVTVPARARDLRVAIGGGSGDADLYVKFDAAPTVRVIANDAWNCVPDVDGNAEACLFASPAAGTWYVKLHANPSYSNVRLQVRYDAPE